MTQGRWLNLSLVQRRLGITRFTAYRWIHAGYFGTQTRQTITGRWQIAETAVLAVEHKMRADYSANSANGSSQTLSRSASS